MKHLYKILGIVALLLLIGLLIAFYIHGKNKPQDFSGETTHGTTAVATSPSNETQPGQTTTPVIQGDQQIPNITIPKDDLTDDTIPDATPAETTAPEYSWTGGGIVLPGDNLEGL